ncbi:MULTISPECIES: cell division protein FtsQ/DivIB [Enterococcus]|uniref:cell division protein FtsQ/DivIB n=1 Tax=Enterococcus TaxID=1350 RepID=UPI000459F4B2|nr:MULTISPECIES: cell division protein FtsQ/DivIB [Enterococcus]EGO2682188.1 FtsQ-type POTRA domain-containing protein [Enterococcus faecalis]EHB5047741.1 FtsQ-type POTRA domain-containing protein [Enterococcus faecalis]EKJ0746861.1 FtsQ-type POTRA domain-containing protein [Enterococcus faecalis]EME5444534.1 FtsQ-type POTRA domain-containing protein [Enterococcus faecalis]KAJ60404.1 Cell division protein FtsQ [Enterococcus faecalis KS19]
MWKISNENDIFKKRKPLPPKKSEESQPELTPWQKQNQEYLKKQAEEAASKGENEQAEVIITLQEQSQEEPQQHLPQETVEEEEHFADRLPNVKKTRNKRLYRRLAFILTCLGTAILVALYFVSPLSRLSEVTVSGNKSVESQAIIQQSKLETGSGLWEQYSNRNYFSANIQKKFPIIKKANIKLNGINSFKIDIQEYQIVALAATKGGYHPILENGKTLAETTKAAESGKPIFENFKEDKLIPELMASYNKLPQEIKQGISEIKYAPSKTNKDLINVYMNDGNRVIVNISDLSEKMAYYSQVAEQMDKPGIVDMEVGIFSYPYEKESEETGSEVSEDSAVENQEVADPNAGVATDEANNGTPINGENQEVQQAE